MWQKNRVAKYEKDLNTKEKMLIRGEYQDLWALGITFYKLTTGRYPF